MNTTDLAFRKQAIDRLSSLPPELLDMIFDHAYPIDDYPDGPLSKRLLPYYYQGIYRRWESWTDDNRLNSVDGTIVHLQKNSVAVAEFIREMHIPEEHDSSIFFGLSTLLNLSTRLTSLELNYVASQTFVDGIHVANLVNLTHLDYLSPVHTVPNPDWIDEDDEETNCEITCSSSLRYLQHLPSLTRLTLRNWHSVDDDEYVTEEDFTFDNIVSLAVQGPGSLDSDLDADIFDHCPNIRHLKLLGRYLDPFSYDEDTWLDHYDQVIPILPLDLVTLSLSSPFNVGGGEDDSCAVDHEFPHFPRLESLHLGDTFYSHHITSVLRDHPTLRKLHLGQGEHGIIEYLYETKDTESSGLEQIILDCLPESPYLRGDPARVRFHLDDYLNNEAPDLREEQWHPPSLAFDHLPLEDLEDLIYASAYRGVQLSGTLIDGYHYFGDWTAEWDVRDAHNGLRGWYLDQSGHGQRNGRAEQRSCPFDGHVGVESRLRALDWSLSVVSLPLSSNVDSGAMN